MQRSELRLRHGPGRAEHRLTLMLQVRLERRRDREHRIHGEYDYHGLRNLRGSPPLTPSSVY